MTPLRLGVLGLGPAWRRRYRPAVLADRQRFRLVAVADPVYQRAAVAARDLGCQAAEGPADLARRADLDAVLVADPGWYRLLPAEAAVRAGKAVFCDPPPAADADHAERLRALLRTGGPVVRFARPLECHPALDRLMALVGSKLGTPQLLRCRGRLVDCVAWCLRAVGEAPARVQAAGTEAAGAALLLWADGFLADLAGTDAAGFAAELITDRGTARLTGPTRLTWTVRRRTCRERFRPPADVGRANLERFHAAVTGGAAEAIDWSAEWRAAAVMRAVRQSQREGRAVAVDQ
jgi:predicted dehydrogenase